MKVLVVCSYNKGSISRFVQNQVESVKRYGIHTEYFLIQGKGMIGYLTNYVRLRKVITKFKPDIIHAHYGLSGLLAVLQRDIPVITTFHGSDLNLLWVRPFSILTHLLSKWSVFVSQKLVYLARAAKDYSIIPCGVDLDCFYPLDQKESRNKLGYPADAKLILFSGAFKNKVKNYLLAKKAVNSLNESNKLKHPVELIELKGYSSEEVNLLLNACDLALMTSISEGSPNFIKEALACNRPIVSTDVGDVRALTEGITGCFIAESKAEAVADKISQALQFENSIVARQWLIDHGLESNETARKIARLYEKVFEKHRNERRKNLLDPS